MFRPLHRLISRSSVRSLSSGSKSFNFDPKLKETHTPKSTTSNRTRTWGQPTYETHPHLIKSPQEITPGVTKAEYKNRRLSLANMIRQHTKKNSAESRNNLVIIPSASKQYMSDKIPYFFRQNSDFLYLTGCQEPDTCLLLIVGESPDRDSSILFMRPKDSHSEKWDGPRTGPDGAAALFGVDQGLPGDEIEKYLDCYSKANKGLYLWYDLRTQLQVQVHQVVCSYLQAQNGRGWESPKLFIHNLRLYKSDAEIGLMQRSCDVASLAFVDTIKMAKPGTSEHQMYAKMDYECRMSGAEFLAYPPVVAGGGRANVIHYINNDQVVRDGEMVLMDAGCEYHGYSSDITRTWPINGEFTRPQLELYEVVLYVQDELIKQCSELPTLDRLFDRMCALLGRGLQEVGVLSKHLSEKTLLQAAYDLCPHHVSHYLGMDVHDTPLITRNIPIQPRMIITVEPGIYVSDKHTKVPPEFRGLGIRIEDDVLVTESGPVVLSRRCPKSVGDLERLSRNS